MGPLNHENETHESLLETQSHVQQHEIAPRVEYQRSLTVAPLC